MSIIRYSYYRQWIRHWQNQAFENKKPIFKSAEPWWWYEKCVVQIKSSQFDSRDVRTSLQAMHSYADYYKKQENRLLFIQRVGLQCYKQSVSERPGQNCLISVSLELLLSQIADIYILQNTEWLQLEEGIDIGKFLIKGLSVEHEWNNFEQ